MVLVTKNSGANFTATTSVKFNGSAATGTTFNSTTQVTATVPGSATTGVVTAVTSATTLTGGTFAVTSAPAPTITQFSPVRAPVGTSITLDGTNFTSVTQVRFGTAAAPGFTVVSATRLTVPVPANAPNAHIYVVAGGGMAQTAGIFTLISPPTITAFTSTFGIPGSQVVITGTNFTNATAVTFGGGADATTFTVNSATLITATVPTGATTGPLSVTTVAGTATSASSFVVTAPAPPTITAFAPAAGAVGMAVILTGTNFTGAAGVRFGTTIATSFTVNSSTQITVTVPVGASTSRIAVVTSGGQALTATTFKVVPVPVISSFTPGAGSPGSIVIITGTGLSDATAVRFGGVNAPTFTVNAATSITATVPVGAVSGSIQVTTAGGTATSAGSFTVTAPVAPTLTAVNPTSGPVGSVVTLTGSFTGVTAVRLGATPVTTFTVNSATQITATVPAGAITGRFFVLATGGLCQSPVFTVIQPPTITSLTPDNGTIGSTVVMRGTNLTGATVVRFGGVSAPSFVVNSATQLTTTVPTGALTGVVSVTTVAGTASSAGSFTVTVPPPPTVSSFSLAAGMPGTAVTLTGTNFVIVRRVLFNGKDAESFVVVSGTTLRATVPFGATTGPVAVINDGGLGQSATAFTVQTPPDIETFSPVRGPVGTVIILTGKGFAGATGLTVGGTTVTSFTVNSATKITATVPVGATTGPVSVTTPVATSFSAQAFTVTPARPDGIGWVATEPVQVVPYPNPATTGQRLQVRVVDWPADLGQAAVDLYDALGRRLATAAVDPQTEEASFDLRSLAAGIYVVRCAGHARQVLVTEGGQPSDG